MSPVSTLHLKPMPRSARIIKTISVQRLRVAWATDSSSVKTGIMDFMGIPFEVI